MSQVLSQDEIDALLQGVGGGEVETETDNRWMTTSFKHMI